MNRGQLPTNYLSDSNRGAFDHASHAVRYTKPYDNGRTSDIFWINSQYVLPLDYPDTYFFHAAFNSAVQALASCLLALLL